MTEKVKTPEEIEKLIIEEDLLGEKTEKRDCLPNLLKFLKSNIKRNYYFLKNGGKYQEIWEHYAKYFESKNRFIESKIILENLYNELTISQIKNKKYVHKGMPLVWLRDICARHQQPWSAQRYMLLTIIEDSIATSGDINPNKTGSYFRAVWYHGIKDDYFWKFSDKANQIYLKSKKKYMFPERILLELNSWFSIEYPNISEIDSFLINKVFMKYWYNSFDSNKKGFSKEFEDFCAYLLYCIPGFEVLERYKTGDYHYDALVRIKCNPKDFRNDFGNYIISESKYWSSPITTQEIAYFASKMVFSDIKAGIIFSKNGITGKKKNRYAALTLIKSYYKNGRIIMVIDENDIKEIFNAGNLLKILQKKYETARFT